MTAAMGSTRTGRARGAATRVVRQHTERTHWLLFPVILVVGLAPGYIGYVGVAALSIYLIKSGRVPKVNSAIVLACLLLLWTAMSLLWTIDSAMSSTSVLLATVSVAIFVMIVDDIVRRGSWVAIVRMIAASGAIVSVAFLLFAEESANAWTFFTGDYGRYKLPFAGTNYSAYVISIGCAAAIVLLTRRATPLTAKWLFAGIAAVIVDVMALIKTETRGAQLGVILAVVAAVAGLRWARASLVFFMIALAAAAVVSLTGSLAAVGADLFLGAGDSRGLSGREQVWASASTVSAEQPFLGYGVDGYITLLWGGIGAHNLFMALTLGLGVVGCGFYLLLLMRIFWPFSSRPSGAGRACSMADDDGLRLLATFLAVSIPIWSTGVWEWAPFNWVMLATCAGAATLRGDSVGHRVVRDHGSLDAGDASATKPAAVQSRDRSSRVQEYPTGPQSMPSGPGPGSDCPAPLRHSPEGSE